MSYVLVAVLVVPCVYAVPSTHPDTPDDVVLSALPAAGVPCDAPTADILTVSLGGDDETISLQMELAAVGEPLYACGGAPTRDAGRAYYGVFLSTPAASALSLTLNDPLLSARVVTDGLADEPCIQVRNGTSLGETCLGSFARDGRALLWTLPRAALPDVGEERIDLYSSAILGPVRVLEEPVVTVIDDVIVIDVHP